MPLILVVDDEEPVRLLLRDTLELDAYEVRDAVDGPGALESFDERRPDGVILDIRMPRMSGIDVLKEIAPDRVGPTCP
jgi:CheY-like chemotaxis protein